MINSNGISILVVDDNLSHYEIVSRMIRKSSLTVSSIINCESYQKSQEMLSKVTPDVVLLDYMLPDSTDLELITYMKSNKQTRFIPIVVITSEGSEFVAVEALKKGAMDYIVKSSDTGQVIEYTIKNAIEKINTQKQLEFSHDFLKKKILKLRTAYNFKAKFLNNVNREIRPILKEISKLSNSIASVKEDEDQNQFLEIFQKSNLCLSEFIKSISDYSKIERGHLKEKKEKFSLFSLMNSIVEVARPQAEQKGFRLSYSLDEILPTYINGDAKKILRIILNLVSNVLKFSNTKVIAISVEKNGEEPLEKLRFSISDSNINSHIIPSKVIKSKNRNNIQQRESFIDKQFAGGDIRLFLSKRIVEFIGGKIWVDYNEVNVLKFIFEIPF